MTHASLFSGIGGFDLAAEWMGWHNAFHCEINEFCTKILNYHFPDAEHYTDITRTDFSKWGGRIDVLSGGFPCQPFSLAGQRKGADDDRYLWPQMLRAIREIRPTWVVGENVAGILTMVQPGAEVEVGGQASLFGEDYRKRVLHQQEYVIETICRDLEREGYAVQPLLIPACAVGAPHRRDRIWFIAHRTNAGVEAMQFTGQNGIYAVGNSSHTDGDRHKAREEGERAESCGREYFPQSEKRGDAPERFNGLDGLSRIAADPYGTRQKCGNDQRTERWSEPDEPFKQQYSSSIWEKFPTQSPIRRRYDGISTNVVRYIRNEVYEELYKHYGSEDLSGLWQVIQQEKVRFEIGRLYEIPQPDILLQIMQRTSQAGRFEQSKDKLSPWSKETSKRVLRYLRNNPKLASSSLGQKYKEQYRGELTDTLSELSHEIALATKKIIEECEKTSLRVRQESVKAYGNAIVPQIAYEIFKTIELCQ